MALRTRRVIALSTATALALVAVGIAWSMFEVRWLAVRTTVVSHPDVPPGFDGARVAFVTDAHAGELLGGEHVDLIAEAVAGLEADVVLLGGDYAVGPGGVEMFERRARRFNGRLGSVGVLGNHEAKWDLKQAATEFRSLDIVLVHNDNVRVMSGGDTIRIAGIGDGETRDVDAQRAANEISKTEFAILLAHNPDTLPSTLAETKGAFDLALSGHTHGGQITAFGLWAPFLPSRYGQRFRGGWTEVEDVTVLVSKGAGAFVLPARFFARPEIHLLELRTGPASVRHSE